MDYNFHRKEGDHMGILTASGEHVRITVPSRYYAYTANGSK